MEIHLTKVSYLYYFQFSNSSNNKVLIASHFHSHKVQNQEMQWILLKPIKKAMCMQSEYQEYLIQEKV